VPTSAVEIEVIRCSNADGCTVLEAAFRFEASLDRRANHVDVDGARTAVEIDRDGAAITDVRGWWCRNHIARYENVGMPRSAARKLPVQRERRNDASASDKGTDQREGNERVWWPWALHVVGHHDPTEDLGVSLERREPRAKVVLPRKPLREVRALWRRDVATLERFDLTSKLIASLKHDY